MSKRIAKHFITDLVNRSDIVSLIDFYVPLKKTGANYSACCPFHLEKTPSFSVSPDKQFYHCFGCGAHGNVISFLMEYERLEYVDAIEELARVNGVDVVYEQTTLDSAQQKAMVDQQEHYFQLMEKACIFFKKALQKTPVAQDYLQTRGLSSEVIQQYSIGYAPNEWNGLMNHLAVKRIDDLVDLGLVIYNADKNRHYDRFRHRIMFPIHDRRGRVIGFGGRVLSAEDSPKYLNSPETVLFHKGEELYGLYLAKKQNRRLDSLIIVEGYMDVVALAQYGITNAIATLGTATTEQHAQRLLRSTSKLIFCFDGDKAGKAAAWRALENLLPYLSGQQGISFSFLPDGEDPDSLVRKLGAASFLDLMNKGQPFSDYFFNHLQQETDISTLDGRSKFIQTVNPYVAKLPDGVYRDLLLEKLGDLVKLSEEKLTKRLQLENLPTPNTGNLTQTGLAQGASAQASVSNDAIGLSDDKKAIIKKVKLAVCVLTKKPSLAMNVQGIDDFAKLTDVGAEFLAELIEVIQAQNLQNTAVLLEHYRGNRRYDTLVKLAAMELLFSEENYEAELNELVIRLKNEQIQQVLDFLYQKANLSGLSAQEKAQLREYQKKKFS